jgi:hypothetical protein
VLYRTCLSILAARVEKITNQYKKAKAKKKKEDNFFGFHQKYMASKHSSSW